MRDTMNILAAGEYGPVGLLILVVLGLIVGIMLATHLIGPKRSGPIKDSTYESGVDPIGDTRKRFNVRFYMVAMLFLLFDVEIAFFYPWAALFQRLHAAPGTEYAPWATAMRSAGFGPGFFLVEMLIFIAVLLVGYVYAWRKGVFKWD